MAASALRGEGTPSRRYHLSLSTDIPDRKPELLSLIRDAGITTVWLDDFLWGHQPYTREKIAATAAVIRKAGIDGEQPAVCSWLPTARTALVWNLSTEPKSLTLRFGAERRTVAAPALGLAEVRL